MRPPQQRDLLAAHSAATREPPPRQVDLLTGKSTRAQYYGRTVRPSGYAARPGTGPEGERCSTCRHCVFRVGTRGSRYYKCRLMEGRWTAGRGSDIAYRSPACHLWQRGDAPSKTGAQRYGD